jgi:hypothetical protein
MGYQDISELRSVVPRRKGWTANEQGFIRHNQGSLVQPYLLGGPTLCYRNLFSTLKRLASKSMTVTTQVCPLTTTKASNDSDPNLFQGNKWRGTSTCLRRESIRCGVCLYFVEKQCVARSLIKLMIGLPHTCKWRCSVSSSSNNHDARREDPLCVIVL